jgi:putative Ca2+/H+ antiporter (TMEM165/GDT1 family)
MSVILNSTYLVAIAEIGDKTQLLSILLAARFRSVVPIILAILFATLLNHSMAAYAGYYIGSNFSADYIRYFAGGLFILVGLWTLIPDDAPKNISLSIGGVFITSFIAFFIAEMGDKTQLATVTLSAATSELVSVVIGTTIGMLLVNIPAVILGNKILDYVSLNLIRKIAAISFIVFGICKLTNIF